jgi:hypothetical protein
VRGYLAAVPFEEVESLSEGRIHFREDGFTFERGGAEMKGEWGGDGGSEEEIMGKRRMEIAFDNAIRFYVLSGTSERLRRRQKHN